MKLDASVRCCCFEENKLKPGPVPYEDLYIDRDGYLSSRKLDTAFRRYDYRRFDARYGQLSEDFGDWVIDCCEHENGEYYSLCLGGGKTFNDFARLLKALDGKRQFPFLRRFLPDGNGNRNGYPAEKAQATLDELNHLLEMMQAKDQIVLEENVLSEEIVLLVEQIRILLLASIETGNPIRWEKI